MCVRRCVCVFLWQRALVEVRAGGLSSLTGPACPCLISLPLVAAVSSSLPSLLCCTHTLFSAFSLALYLSHPPQASPCVPALPEPAAPTSSSAASLAGGINHVFWEGHSAIYLPDTSCIQRPIAGHSPLSSKITHYRAPLPLSALAIDWPLNGGIALAPLDVIYAVCVWKRLYCSFFLTVLSPLCLTLGISESCAPLIAVICLCLVHCTTHDAEAKCLCLFIGREYAVPNEYHVHMRQSWI